LCASGKRAAYIGSNGIDYAEFHYDTANTTPESCELHYHFSKMVAAGIEYVAMEVSSQALYMNRVYGIDFETVVFTNLSSDDHIGGVEHPTYEHYRDCKRSLFFMHNAKNMVYNADDAESSYMVNPVLDLYPVSLKGKGSFNADRIEPYCKDGVLGISFRMSTSRASYDITTRSPGNFSAYNAMIAMVCAKLCGVNFAVSAKKLASISVLGRFECVDIAKDRYFIIDYAHNGFSLKSVLTALKAYPHGRLVCLFGSVGGRTKSRRAALGEVAAELCDMSILTSDNPDCEPPQDVIDDIAKEFIKRGNNNYVMIPDRDDAIKYAVEHSLPSDILLLAGKGHEKYQLIDGKKYPFSEKALLEKYSSLIPKETAVKQR
jgi:UDP-N-acetylmuramoyl-L-alanyl-D-glutamate--2,6-diaminopimelate ligase